MVGRTYTHTSAQCSPASVGLAQARPSNVHAQIIHTMKVRTCTVFMNHIPAISPTRPGQSLSLQLKCPSSSVLPRWAVNRMHRPPYSNTYTVVSQKSAHGRSTLQVRQRRGWTLFRVLPHLTTKEHPYVMFTATRCPRRK